MEPDLQERHDVCQIFDQVAGLYDRHAALEQEVSSRLLERLEFLRLPPHRIVDLGCGTGQASAALKGRFRKAQVIGLDISQAMLSQFQRRSGLLRPLGAVCADFTRLPLADRCADLVFSNLAFQWNHDVRPLFAEIRRILAPGGMLLFSSLGPGSLREFAEAWPETDESANVSGFADILDVGDALMAAGFQEPVMDAERITLSYPDIDAMVRELEATGTASFLLGSNGLQESKRRLKAAYERFAIDGRYPVSYEVIYGTAFGPQEGQPRKTAEGDLVTFSVDSLLKSKPGGRSAGNN